MLIDGYGRRVNYLRISVTERCNFRCQYCMPQKPFSWVPKENLLSFEELFEFVKVAIDEGIEKIRITGGEPTLREDLDKFIKMIYDYKSDIDLAMTTNGYLLKECAKKLKNAGLKRINISLDSLKSEIAAKIAGRDVLKNVLEGIDEAIEVGLKIKINMVPLKSVNEDEIIDILEFGKKREIRVRFIEYMENVHAYSSLKGMHGKEILEKIKKKYEIEKVGRVGSSPAFLYRLKNGYIFGLIDPHKHDFCET
ncbi:MAG TPA: GTP 3',8-cyclase MoaA, partial [Campylobacterales bacterium]|nr:GTP 3',8-cyclase MoaA [Campylobacterales bacterium]